jgi:hypothetical protein
LEEKMDSNSFEVPRFPSKRDSKLWREERHAAEVLCSEVRMLKIEFKKGYINKEILKISQWLVL